MALSYSTWGLVTSPSVYIQLIANCQTASTKMRCGADRHRERGSTICSSFSSYFCHNSRAPRRLSTAYRRASVAIHPSTYLLTTMPYGNLRHIAKAVKKQMVTLSARYTVRPPEAPLRSVRKIAYLRASRGRFRVGIMSQNGQGLSENCVFEAIGRRKNYHL